MTARQASSEGSGRVPGEWALDQGAGRGSRRELHCRGWWQERGEPEDPSGVAVRRSRERRQGWTAWHLISYVGKLCFILRVPTLLEGLPWRLTASDLRVGRDHAAGHMESRLLSCLYFCF